jgi:hypothetical protein
VRLLGAALLLATAGIHLHLWQQGYRSIHVVGVLFLLDAVTGVVAAAALLAVPGRWLPLTAMAGAGLQLGTLGGLALSATVGVFGFVETWQAPWVAQSIVVEVTGGVLLLGWAAPLVWRALRERRWRV